MTLVEWLQFLATTAAWGAVSSFITQLLKKVNPAIENGVARAASAIVAVLVGFVAQALVPWAGQLPVAVQAAIIWVASVVFYELCKWLDWNPS